MPLQPRFLIEGFVADTLSISVENHIDALPALPCHLAVVIVHVSSFSVDSYQPSFPLPRSLEADALSIRPSGRKDWDARCGTHAPGLVSYRVLGRDGAYTTKFKPAVVARKARRSADWEFDWC